ncbi:uncharacterized protein PGTG_11774 [Puccinia graminis f. sp. tritici CRL 75-36-700-3]|uniref:Uncharacterized protein n=1 Tax=Puccinia graminis f. sp. tritici (strain CRL 75-36-700-3 / race SCCL) TaxID=418459 RepID=E3KM93_PUCGT|nr:uncharacterized protein PGTG_11774 [Puccinia graminis f. sp. tritici CRL 75-36-700-3]EFP85418.1 hypothetical protein PGTG_11774 [Puccinia graminis f. sp. tritici CRL 75-36-700-3]
MPQKSEKTLIFQASDDALKIHRPNPLAEDSLKTLPKYCNSKEYIALHTRMKQKSQKNARNMIGKHLALGGRELEEASGKPFSLKNLAKTLDEKFPIFLSYDNRAQVEMLYEYYLKFLKQYQLISDEKNVARKSWMSKLQTEILADHEETKAEISKCLKELQQPNIKQKFKKEYDQIVNNIFNSMEGKLTKEDIEKPFQSAFEEGNSKNLINLDKLVNAREVQLKKRFPTDPRVLDLEHVFQNLPTDMDIKELVFRYVMIEGFENLVKGIHPDLNKILNTQAQTGINIVLRKDASVFKNAAREDDEWLENSFMKFYGTTVGPKEVFDRLKGLPQEEEIIRKSEDPDKNQKIEALGDLRIEAQKYYKFNLPLVKELNDKGILDEGFILSAEGTRAYMDLVFLKHPFRNTPVSSVIGKQIAETLDLKLQKIENLLYQHFPNLGKYFEELLKTKGYFSIPNTPPQAKVPRYINATPLVEALSAKRPLLASFASS